jgi:hypothetical protein
MPNRCKRMHSFENMFIMYLYNGYISVSARISTRTRRGSKVFLVYVFDQLIGARNMEGLKRESGFEAGQMRHGLELMIAKNALRRYLRNKTAANRRYLARVRGDIYRRLGVSDDAAQNEMGIREIDEISRALEGSGRRGAGAEEEERRGRRWSRREGDERETR